MRRVASIAIAVITALGVAGCAPAPELRMAGAPGDAAAVAMAEVALDQPVAVGSVMLCLSAPGSASITAVALHDPQGGEATVSDFGARLNPVVRGIDGLGATRQGLEDASPEFAATPSTVAGVCPSDPAAPDAGAGASLVELGVEVVRRTGDWAGASALDVMYEIDGATRVAVIPMGIWLCAATCPPETEVTYRASP